MEKIMKENIPHNVLWEAQKWANRIAVWEGHGETEASGVGCGSPNIYTMFRDAIHPYIDVVMTKINEQTTRDQFMKKYFRPVDFQNII